MAPRSRSVTFTREKGYGVKSGIVIGTGLQNCGVSQCDDHTGPGDCESLFIEKWFVDGGIINKHTGGFYAAKMYDYAASVCNDLQSFPHLSLSNVPSNVEAATKAAARTNPSRPYVDVPVALLELGDVVQLVRDSGRSLARRAAGANIKYQFGIAPLASDVAKLFYFQDQLNRRLREFDRLVSDKGLRRTVDIGTYSSSGTQNLYCQSQYVTIQRLFTGITTERVRAHCRWSPTVNPQHLRSPDLQRKLMSRAMLGLTVDFSTLWEALPWSWLIDWGSNVGEFFQAHRNIIPAQLRGVHVMRHQRTVWTCNPYVSGDGETTMTPITFKRENKRRQASFVAPVAHFPFLNGKQMGILASLSVLRGGR